MNTRKNDLLKDEFQPSLRDVLKEAGDSEQITFTHLANVEETIELSDQDKVNDLLPHHIWTNEYAQARLHWKPMLPLSILLLRVYSLESPVHGTVFA